MSDITPTYQFYTGSYKGSLDSADFEAALPDALARVNERVSHRSLVNLPTDEIEAYRMAVCAVCDIVDEPAVNSWSAGKARVEYQDAVLNGTASTIDRYLSGTTGQILYGAWL